MNNDLRITATINIRDGKNSRTLTVTTPTELATHAVTALVMAYGPQVAKSILDDRLERAKPTEPHDKIVKHVARQYSDQMICSCGLAWDMNDPCPPEGH